jgi:sugar O-acyltransferase (sialic acid O-acetyltransferase NeuD family)
MIIIGTGAVAAELTLFFPYVDGYLEFPENKSRFYDKYQLKAPILGTIDSYEIKESDRFVLGIADIQFRKKMIEKIKSRGGRFINLIHHSVLCDQRFVRGEGNIIYPACLITVNVEMGNFNVLTSQSVLSHDCKIGDNNFFATSIINGHVEIGNDNYFGSRSSVLPHVEIGSGNIIQAGQIVDKNVNDNTVVLHRFKENITFPKREN